MNGDQLYLARQVLFMKVGCCFSFSFLGIPLSSYYPLKVAKVTFCTREAMGQLESLGLLQRLVGRPSGSSGRKHSRSGQAAELIVHRQREGAQGFCRLCRTFCTFPGQPSVCMMY